MKILVVAGTRPEAIKLAPVIRALRSRPDVFTTQVCLTAQHRALLDGVIELFGIDVDYDLDVMQTGQTLYQTTGAVLLGMERVLGEARPDLVLVHGDTTTALAAALAAFYGHVPVGHVEAGLRTTAIGRPFPEEMNRRVADQLSTYYYAATAGARNNLLRERVDPARVIVTGNTVIDALLDVAGRPYTFADPALEALGRSRRLILVTAHRRESFGAPLESICRAIRSIVAEHPDTEVVYPVHPNPNVREAAQAHLGGCERVHLIEPLPYQAFVHLMQRSTLILTDSGGIQEEAPSLGKPVLVLREETERPEAVRAGVAQLTGTDHDRIVSSARTLLKNAAVYRRIAATANPYGDGQAGERIADHLAQVWRGGAAPEGRITL